MNELLSLRSYYEDTIKRISDDKTFYYYNQTFLKKLYLESIDQIDKILSDVSIDDKNKKNKYLEYVIELNCNFYNDYHMMSHLISDYYEKLVWDVSKFLNVNESTIYNIIRERTRSISDEHKNMYDTEMIEINKRGYNENYTNEITDVKKSLIYRIFKKKR